MNLSSFRLGDFGFGDITIDVPNDVAFYTDRLDYTASKGFMVDVVAGIDVAKGEIFWTLTTIDPNTGEIPVDPTIGFLPTNVTKGTGEGFVNYSIKPKADVTTGTVIDAQATIIFTSQEPIDTPSVFNTLDADKPLSLVLAETPTETVTSPEFQVRWSGSDAGSAIAGYTVYVSDNGGAFTPWLINTRLTEATYQGQNGHGYAFYSIATDNAGNRELVPVLADVTVNVDTGRPSVAELIPPAQGQYALGSNLDIAVRFTEAVTVNVGNLVPALTLLIGNTSIAAGYLSGSGTDTLVFRHTVQVGDYDTDGIVIGNAIVLSDSSITDLAGNLAELALAAVDTTGIIINNAPELTLQGSSQTLEGRDYQLTIQTGDADTGNDGLNLVIDWADGSAVQALTAAELSALGGGVSHHYLDGTADLVNPTAYTIQVTASDPLGEKTQQNQHLVVGNVAPDLTVSGSNKVDEGQTYQLNLGSITDPGQDIVNQIIVNWGDGSQNSYSSVGNISHVFANGGVQRHISVDLVDEDGQYNAVANKDVAVYDTETLGNAPALVTKANPNAWVTPWTATDVSISHKADVGNSVEVWSNIGLNGLVSNFLAGGDVYAGDLGVSGQTTATSSVKQEIDGTEALRFSLTHLAHEASVTLSRLFAHDDNIIGVNEAGRVQAYNGSILVAEKVFNADNANGQKLITLDVNQGFNSLVFTTGAYDSQNHFVSGAYSNDAGQFATAPYATGATQHGSDYLIDILLVGVKPEESFL